VILSAKIERRSRWQPWAGAWRNLAVGSAISMGFAAESGSGAERWLNGAGLQMLAFRADVIC
jgi:hypothetical protein